MQISISNSELSELVIRQTNNLFGFDEKRDYEDLIVGIKKVLEKIEYCFAFRKNKYYRKNGVLYFSPFQADQYAIFLYYLSNILYYKIDSRELANKIYLLNKTLSLQSLDLLNYKNRNRLRP